jgi:hypothetical protein
MEYYNQNIQIDKSVINDIFSNITPTTKMLVFGLGYDSKMWYLGNNKNTFFVENNDDYINLNKNDIDPSNIIKYDYKTRCDTCTKLSDDEIKQFEIPTRLRDLAPFDIILVDGPEGWAPHTPGRLISSYWSTQLASLGTIIYIDDSSRPVEQYCVNKFFNNKIKHIFPERLQCTKIYN